MKFTQPACSEVCWQLLLAQVVLTVHFSHSLLFYLIIQKVKSQMLLSSPASFPSRGAIIEPNEACSPTYGRAISNVRVDYISPCEKLMPSPTNADRNRMYTVKSQNGLLNFCILQFLRLQGTIWKTHTFCLQSAIVLMVFLVLQKRAELARYTWLLPFFPMTQRKNEERKQNLLLIFILLSVTKLAWSVLQCV